MRADGHEARCMHLAPTERVAAEKAWVTKMRSVRRDYELLRNSQIGDIEVAQRRFRPIQSGGDLQNPLPGNFSPSSVGNGCIPQTSCGDFLRTTR